MVVEVHRPVDLLATQPLGDRRIVAKRIPEAGLRWGLRALYDAVIGFAQERRR